MDKFISINVNQGDAFYLKRAGVRILIDGGRSRCGFKKQFKQTIDASMLDVVACTHADADHINGLLGFFESGFQSREVWLPGAWTSRLRDLLINPDEFLQELIKQIDEIGNHEITSLEDYYDKYGFRESNDMNLDEPSSDINEIYKAIEEAPERSSFFGLIYCFQISEMLRPYIRQSLDNCTCKLFIDAIDTAKKIRELAILAFNSGAKIRWFEFQGSGTASGGESHLKPVNSNEIFRISKRLSALEYLSITRSNRESLVFYSPSSNGSGDVLFSADSDFSFQQIIPIHPDNSIITAPHHGSEDNKNAYSRLKSGDRITGGCITRKTIIVRSDGRSSKRPGSAYKSLVSKKICTLCRHPDTEGQNVIFLSAKYGWKRKNGMSWCHCI